VDSPLLAPRATERPEPRPRVWVVDDDPGVRTALSRLLRATALEVETFASARDCLDRLPRERPRCLVLDLTLPDLSGLDLIQILHRRGEPIPVVFISGTADVGSSVQAMKQGAVDFLEKPVDADALLAAIMRALAREAEWRSTRARIDEATRLLERLTPRERQVFQCLTEGRSNKQIAGDLGTSEKTIKVHRGRVMHKLGIRSVVELVHLTARAVGLS
jgi:FixJ family two-component response regulator